MPAYQQSLYFGGEVAVKLHQSVFCLPSSVSLSEEDIHTTVTALDALPA
jgi:dTDP-4-amino-4,6-dideoxygalactose transaminase